MSPPTGKNSFNPMQDSGMKQACTESHLEHRIFPVILPVPLEIRGLKGRERVLALSRLARQALDICSRKGRLRLGELLKDTNGAPMPFDGLHWSLTHKPKYVGAVISFEKTGIDIEEVRTVSHAMFQRVAGDGEWRRGGSRTELLFFRFWTAKEAVLKAEGVGMTGLSNCVVTKLWDRRYLEVAYQDRRYLIEQVYFNGHIAAVVKNGFDSQWTIQHTHFKRSEQPCSELS
jgi:4'-phosphopantetheinyl transferase